MRRGTPTVAVELKTGQELTSALVRLGDERSRIQMQEVEGDECHGHLHGAPADGLGAGQAHPALERLKARTALSVEGDYLAVHDRRTPAERIGQARQLRVAMARVLSAARRDSQRAPLAVGQCANAVPLDLERPVVALGRDRRGGRKHRLEVARQGVGHALIIGLSAAPARDAREAGPALAVGVELPGDVGYRRDAFVAGVDEQPLIGIGPRKQDPLAVGREDRRLEPRFRDYPFRSSRGARPEQRR